MTPSEAADLLNDFVRADPEAMHGLFVHRVPCNEGLAEHPRSIAGKDGTMSLMGIFNSVVGTETERLAAVFAADGSLTGFCVVTGKHWNTVVGDKDLAREQP